MSDGPEGTDSQQGTIQIDPPAPRLYQNMEWSVLVVNREKAKDIIDRCLRDFCRHRVEFRDLAGSIALGLGLLVPLVTSSFRNVWPFSADEWKMLVIVLFAGSVVWLVWKAICSGRSARRGRALMKKHQESDLIRAYSHHLVIELCGGRRSPLEEYVAQYLTELLASRRTVLGFGDDTELRVETSTSDEGEGQREVPRENLTCGGRTGV